MPDFPEKKTQHKFLCSLKGDATYLIQDETRVALCDCTHLRAHCKNIHTSFIALALFGRIWAKNRPLKLFSPPILQTHLEHFRKTTSTEEMRFRVWSGLGFVVRMLPC